VIVTELTVSAPPVWPRRRVLSWLVASILILGLALLLRYGVIQPHSMGLACIAGEMPWWCPLREALVQMHIHAIWGWVALGASLVAFLFHWNIALKVGFAFSLMALVIYNADFGAFGLVLSLLRLARS